MSVINRLLAHHTEPVDPQLVDWLRHKIDDVLGLDSTFMVFALGAVIVLFPLGLLALVWIQRRKASRPR
ncbi:MAG: hypothetical protein O2788_03235 [Chloroflexi bacterium]|nr:hypothetical protein [Chloroflexota bacterium]